MRKLFILLGLLLLLPLGASAAEPPVLPFSEVRAGMTGTGRTVFRGTTIETFDVEILGTLPNVGPDRNLILARCSGGTLAESGVFAGMSGSPVFIDGRLVGAVAYAWGFAKDAIAGITPIEEMLAIPAGGGAAPGPLRRGHGVAPGDWERLREPDRVLEFLTSRVLPALQPPAGATALPLPLNVAGLGPTGFGRVGPNLVRAGFLPLQGASAAADAGSVALEPGAAVGLKLIRGDIDMTATGTVTWVDGDRVFAFGHPLFGLGSVDLPMTGARAEIVLPSLYQSSRFATPLGEVGAVREDRASGIFGRVNARPRMVPVRVRFDGAQGDGHDYSFDIVDDPLLTPILLFNALNGIMTSRENPYANASLRLREGSVIKMMGQEDVSLDNLFVGNNAFDYGSALPAYILYLLMNNDWEPPQIAGVNLLFEYDEAPRSARILRVSLDRYKVAPGQTVKVTAVYSPYRGPDQAVTQEVRIPAETPEGPLTIQVGGAFAISRNEQTRQPLMPRDLAQFIWLVNNLRRNDRLYIAAFTEDTGAFLGGARLPNLPPSVTGILSRPRSQGNVTVMRLRGLFEEAIEVPFAVAGAAKIALMVESP